MDDAVDVHVISEDMQNPCLTIVLEPAGGHWKPRSMTTDIPDLIYAIEKAGSMISIFEEISRCDILM
jgi:hypothetical protein